MVDLGENHPLEGARLLMILEKCGIEFSLSMSAWFALFRRSGFVVEEYRAPRPGRGGQEVVFSAMADRARRYPSEQVCKLRKAGEVLLPVA
jgi:hypothetical protein